MDDEYTPSTLTVRDAYAAHHDVSEAEERLAEFDRWLRQERARIWAQGYGAGASVVSQGREHVNPYEGG